MSNELENIQSQALHMYANGQTVAQIGEAMGITEHSVVLILKRAKEKLAAKTLAHAVAIYVRSRSK